MRYVDTSVLLAFLVPEAVSNAGDSLHLAVADAHRATKFTFDQGMAMAGATLGIAVGLLEIT